MVKFGNQSGISNEVSERLSRFQGHIRDISEGYGSTSIEDIRKVARAEDATLVFYSLISNHNSSLPGQLYIWVVKPSGEISFVDQSNVTDFQGSINNFTSLLRRFNCEYSPRNLSDSCRDFITQADTAMRGGYPSIGVTDRAVQFNSLGQDSNNIDIKLNNLYQLLIAPIEDLFPSSPEEKVIFIPDGALNFIPFAALRNPDNRKYLVEEHSIITAPNMQTLRLCLSQNKDQRNLRRKRALVVGDPAPMPNQLPELPGARKEAYDIAALLKDRKFVVDKYIGEKATKRIVTRAMNRNPQVIHLATHGIIDSQSSGAIVLAEKYLDATEVFNTNLPNTELVVLSACNTGMGELVPGGVVGLPLSFSAAGVPSVLMSLWAVPDDKTAELMTNFYKHWLDGEGKAQALRLAMVEMSRSYPNEPQYWAAFSLVGSSE